MNGIGIPREETKRLEKKFSGRLEVNFKYNCKVSTSDLVQGKEVCRVQCDGYPRALLLERLGQGDPDKTCPQNNVGRLKKEGGPGELVCPTVSVGEEGKEVAHKERTLKGNSLGDNPGEE